MVKAKSCRNPLVSKGLWDLLSSLFGTRERLYMHRKALCVKKSGVRPNHESYFSQKPLLWNPSWLRGVCALGGSHDRSDMEKEPDTWPEGRQRLEELTYINDLTASWLHSSSLREMSTPFLSRCVFLCLVSILTKQTISLCALSLVAMLCL